MNNYPQGFVQTAYDRLEIKTGGGCVSFFGIPFLGAGLFVLLMAMQILKPSNASEIPWWGWILLGLMGLVFTAVGGGLAFGRTWITINSTQRQIWKDYGLLRPMKTETYDLDNYTVVVIRQIQGDSDSQDSFPVSLQRDANSIGLQLYSSVSYASSRQQAELIAGFTRLPLTDLTSTHPVTTGADNRLEISSEQQNITNTPQQPPVMQCTVEDSPEALLIKMPYPTHGIAFVIGGFIPLLIFTVIGYNLYGFFNRTNTPVSVQLLFGAFGLLFFLIIPTLGQIKRISQGGSNFLEIVLNSHSLSVYRNGKHDKPVYSTPLADINQIDYGTRSHEQSNIRQAAESVNLKPGFLKLLTSLASGKGITIKSRGGLYRFGERLSDGEVLYLHWLLNQRFKK